MPNDNSELSSDRSDEDLIPSNYHWIRFKWMLWVGCCMHWNRRWEFLTALLMPGILGIIIVLVCIQFREEHITAETFTPINLEKCWITLLHTIRERQDIFAKEFGVPTYNAFAPRLVLGYAPHNSALAGIISIACTHLGLRWEQFSTCDELRQSMSTQYFFAGVCFHNASRSYDYPKKLDFTLIFPSELRTYKTKIGERWDTTQLYQVPQLGEHMHGFMTYIDEGFIMIQKKISEAYLFYAPNRAPPLYIQKFPVADHYYDPISEVMQIRMSMLLVFGYITSILHLLKALVIRRNKKLDGLLAILDVTPFIQFYSWLIFTLAFMTMSSIFLLLVLKIPWNNGFAVFNRATFSCLLVFFTAFNIYALSFCYMISKFFRNPKVAISAAPIVWILFYLPFASIVNSSTSFRETIHPFVSLFGISAFGLGIQNINFLENDEGLHWHNFFKSYKSTKTNYSVGTYVLIMCGVSIFQAFIGICVTKIEILFEKFLKKFKKNNQSSNDNNEEGTRHSKAIILEVRANYKMTAVEVIAVTVECGNRVILDDISFSLYEDEITLLMGHNGCGKTMLMQVLAGIITPQSGKVILPGSNNNNETEASSSDFIGICLSDTLLFYDLNVKHQLMFFGRMKGVIPNELKKEVKKFLVALELENFKYTRTEHLTCGQRTKLAVACALIGGSKVVLLDDIVLKLDVRDYELIWGLLEHEKFGRVILASTHLSLEPEMHADNIIIMGRGRLKCVGTGQFLKSMYCFGCHVLIAKKPNCKTEYVTKVLSKYLPDIAPSSDIGREITYTIDSSKIDILESILQELEAKKECLEIMNISIIETPVEELFSKLGAERPAYDDRKLFLRGFNGLSITSEEDDDLVFLKRRIHYEMSSFQRILNQWNAIIYKYTIFYLAHPILLPIFICVPLFFLIYCAITMKPRTEKLMPSLEFDISDYVDSSILISSRHKSLTFIDAYKQFVYWKNSNIKMIEINSGEAIEYMLNEQRQKKYANLNLKVILGLTFHTFIVAWFNAYLPHIAPLTMNLLYNGILRANGKIDNQIYVQIELLPMENSIDVQELSKYSFNMGSFLAIFLSFIACYMVTIRALLLVSERTNGFMYLQRLAGLSASNYWICLFIFDVITHTIILIIGTTVLWLLMPPTYVSVSVLRWFFILLLLMSTALCATIYLLCLFFKSSHRAYLFITTLHCLGISLYIAFYGDLNEQSISLLPRIFPLYSFCVGLQNVYEHNIRTQLCEDDIVKTLSTFVDKCQKIPNCCERKYHKVENDAMYLWLIIIHSWILIVMYECRSVFKRRVPIDNYDRALDEHERRHASESNEVDAVTAEMIRVQTMKPQNRHFYTAICQNLGFIEKERILVDRISLTIEPGEALGIVGTNCNHTNALRNLLAGTPMPSFGRLYINGVSMTQEPRKARAHIGYVPNSACVMREMTCYQALKMFCILYGYARNEIDEICENLSKNFGFHTQLHTSLQYCSAGIRERISYSIAILKKPALLCIGNYIWTLDPNGRRQLQRIMTSICNQGTSVVYLSVTNCFTELLCNKIVVMNEGQIMHIGRPNEIAPEISKGYVVTMRMKKMAQTSQGITQKVFFRLTTFMFETFPSSLLVHEGSLMQFVIPFEITTLAFVFKTLRANLFQLNIESVLITCMNMTYVFGQITEDAIRKRASIDSCSSRTRRAYLHFIRH